MSITRATDEATWVEILNRYYDRDKGNVADTAVIWRANAATYILDADNAHGEHANFGSGVFTIKDSDVTVLSTVPLVAAKIGPSSTQQHILPAVASDTIALLAATQTLSNKVLASTTSFNAALATPPFTVTTSTAKVTNLHADLLDTAHASAVPTASTIPIADGSGKLDIGWIPAAVGSGTYLPLAGGTMGGSIFFSATNSFDIGDATRKPRSIYLGTSLGIGTSPAVPLDVRIANASNFVAFLSQTDTTDGSFCLGLNQTSTGTSSSICTMTTNGNLMFKFWATGGLTLGAAADKGAGWIVVTNGISKSGAFDYANPDYVFEHYYRGRIEKFAANPGAADYTGLLPLEAVEAYAREHWRLPRVGLQEDIFDRGDILLEKLEEAYLHLFALNRRLLALEGAAPVRAA